MREGNRNKLMGNVSKVNKFPAKAATDRTLLLSVVVIVLVSITVYCNALFNGFAYDDLYQIVQNKWLTDVRYLPEIFSKGVWGFLESKSLEQQDNYYRPAMHLIYMINYHVFGLKPWGFHLVNILFHAGASALVFLIASKHNFHYTLHSAIRSVNLEETGSSASVKGVMRGLFMSVPGIAALLFAVHPVHTEAVTWIGGLPDVSFTFFLLLSFYLYMRLAKGFTGGYFCSLLSFFLATLCKETALVFPILLLSSDLLLTVDKRSVYTRLKRIAPYFMLGGVYLLPRFMALQGFAPMRAYPDLNSYQLVINIFPLFMEYLLKLVLPINLNLWHVFYPVTSLFEAKSVLSLVVTIAFIVLSIIALKRDKETFFCLVLIIVPLLPAFYIKGIIGKPFAERYLYLPSVGFAILAASIIVRARAVLTRWTAIPVIGVTVIIALYSIGTLSRNTDWKDDVTLWSDTVKKSPNDAVCRDSLAFALFAEGRIDEAISQYRIATMLAPGNASIHYHLGVAYAQKGLTREEIDEFEITLQLKPTYAEAHNNLGIAYWHMGLKDEALRHFTSAVRLQPNNAEAYNNLGTLYGDLGDINRAIDCFEAAVRLVPDHPGFRANLDRAYRQRDENALKSR